MIYLNERMGFWILGRTLGSDSAYSFGNFAPGQCANEASGWLTYEMNEWVAVNYVPNCLEINEEDIFTTTTIIPQMGIQWQIDDMLNGGNFTDSNSNDTGSDWWSYYDDDEEKCSEYNLPFLSAGNYSCVGSDAFGNVEQDRSCKFAEPAEPQLVLAFS